VVVVVVGRATSVEVEAIVLLELPESLSAPCGATAKCAGAAGEVTVVVRGRVVVVIVVVVDVDGVDGTSVVVVAAVGAARRVASSAPRARHCRGRFHRDIDRK
jgi:hypothetical protein